MYGPSGGDILFMAGFCVLLGAVPAVLLVRCASPDKERIIAEYECNKRGGEYRSGQCYEKSKVMP